MEEINFAQDIRLLMVAILYRKGHSLLMLRVQELLLLNTLNRVIGLMSRVFANGQGDQGSIPGWDLPKTLKMVLDAALLNTQHYKVRIKGKVEKSREWSSALPYTLV